MERTNFEKLQVYQLSEKIADSIWNIVVTWSPLARDTVGKQIVRSADSIGANIAEGSGRGSLVDNRRFVRMAYPTAPDPLPGRRMFHRGNGRPPSALWNLIATPGSGLGCRWRSRRPRSGHRLRHERDKVVGRRGAGLTRPVAAD